MRTISIAKRIKRNFLGVHYGVCLGNGQIIDIQPEGLKLISETEFSSGFYVTKESSTCVDDLELQGRLNKYKNFVYDLISNNCEHVSRGIVEKKSESRQMMLLFIILGVLGIWWITKE